MKSLFLLLLLLPVFASGQVIETIAGNGVAGYSGDGGSALLAELNEPLNAKFNHTGDMYIADASNNVIRKINTSGIITTVVGTGRAGYSGDNSPATSAELFVPTDLSFDQEDNLYIADGGNAVIRKVNKSTGIITTIAGLGTTGYNGDNRPATTALLNDPVGLIFDNAGNLYFSDGGNARVRMINNAGIISTIAGNGTPGFSGDGGPATAAELGIPNYLAINSIGEIFIADHPNNHVRKISLTGIISTYAGGGTAGDGEPATAALVTQPESVALDDSGNLFIACYSIGVIRKVNTSGIIYTIAGTGTSGYSGDEGLAIDAQFNKPVCSTTDSFGSIYIADEENNRIRKITYYPESVINVEKQSSGIFIYPKPAQNEVTIKSTTAIESVEVVNMMGQVVASSFGKGSGQAASSKEVLLDIRSLPAGVYFVKVSGPDGYRDGGRFFKE